MNDLPKDAVELVSEIEKFGIAELLDFFLKAEYEKASEEAESCMNSPFPAVRDFALMIHILVNVALNNIGIVRNDFKILQEKMQYPESERHAVFDSIFRFTLSTVFHFDEKFASIPVENLYRCFEEGRFLALYVQSYALCLEQKYEEALGMAEAGLMTAANRHPVMPVYLNLVASMAAINLSYFEKADRFFLNALDLAKPKGYIQPFIGHHGPLQGLVEKHIRTREPELYKTIAEKTVLFRRGWTQIHNQQSSHKVTNLLTPYEFSLAMMASKNKTNKEIAQHFHISLGTVKAHLSTIYQKLEITKRSELAKHLNK